MIDNIKNSLRKMISPRAVKNILAFLIAVEAGLAFLGLTFFRTDFLNLMFRIVLIVSDVLFMLGFAWLVNRYIIQN